MISELEKLKEESTGHSLIKAARLYNETMIEKLKTSLDLPKLRAYHLNLFPHIEISGSTVNQIAMKAGVTKQAVSKTVLELIEMRVLAQESNPNDGRSKLVVFAKEGPFTIEKGMKFLADQDHILQDILGDADFQQLKKSLNLIIKALMD